MPREEAQLTFGEVLPAREKQKSQRNNSRNRRNSVVKYLFRTFWRVLSVTSNTTSSRLAGVGVGGPAFLSSPFLGDLLLSLGETLLAGGPLSVSVLPSSTPFARTSYQKHS